MPLQDGVKSEKISIWGIFCSEEKVAATKQENQNNATLQRCRLCRLESSGCYCFTQLLYRHLGVTDHDVFLVPGV